MIRKEKFFIFLDGPVPADRRYIADMTDMELLFWSKRRQSLFFDEPDRQNSKYVCRRAFASDFGPVTYRHTDLMAKVHMGSPSTRILYPGFYDRYRYLL